MTNKPAFNYISYSKEYNLPRNGTKMLLYYLNDLKIHDLEKYHSVGQTIDCGYRMGVEDCDYKYWNQCTVEDIDYKLYIQSHDTYVEPIEVYNNVWNWLIDNYSDISYYSEMSRSKKGFHFIFYFDVDRTYNNWMMCKAMSIWVIKKAFKECGYEEAITYNKVWDSHSSTLYQPIFLTKINCNFNNNCSGKCKEIAMSNYYDIKREYDLMYEKACNIEKKKSNNTKNDNVNNKESYDTSRDKWEISFDFDFDNNEVEYLDHTQRWLLFCSLSGLCGNDDEKLKSLWCECAAKIPEMNGHTKEYYRKCPYINDWNRKRTGKEYIDKNLLNMFNININFKVKEGYEDKSEEKTNKVTKTRVYLP